MTYDSIIHYVQIHAGAIGGVYLLFKEMEWDKPIKKKINETINHCYSRIQRTFLGFWDKWKVSRFTGNKARGKGGQPE